MSAKPKNSKPKKPAAPTNAEDVAKLAALQASLEKAIDAFKRFQISDEMCEKFGYKTISKQDKANIFGLNAARLYKVDLKAKRNALPADALTRLKAEYHDRGGQRENGAYGWVRADD